MSEPGRHQIGPSAECRTQIGLCFWGQRVSAATATRWEGAATLVWRSRMSLEAYSVLREKEGSFCFSGNAHASTCAGGERQANDETSIP